MIEIQAVVFLLARWNRRIDPPLCAHLNVELEHTASVYTTSTCRRCRDGLLTIGDLTNEPPPAHLGCLSRCRRALSRV